MDDEARAYHGTGGTATSKAYGYKKLTWLQSVPSRVHGWLGLEYSNPVLWMPVMIGLGIGIYFGLKVEPSLVGALFMTSLTGLLWWLTAQMFPKARYISVALFLISVGFSVACLRTHYVAGPVLNEQTRAVLVEGTLLEIEEGEEARRLVISASNIQSVLRENIPEKLRVTWRGESFAAEPGDKIRLRAILSPPPDPVAPGSYDFARQLYFERIGAVGYATTPPERITKSTIVSLSSRVEKIRLSIADRIKRSVDPEKPQIAAICVALVTGKREGVSESTEASLRDAGLAHLLAISGLHMGLVAGLLFFSTRLLLVLNTYLALHYPTKKWAAVVALAGAFAYLLISGGAWSTQRAFIMAAVFFLAIIVDRRAISLRNVAIAATLLLLLTPEALFQAGFQMSFAAVTVLIAAYEWYERRGIFTRTELKTGSANKGLIRTILTYIGGLSLTSLLAGFATAPFALFHFNRYAAYGLAGNLLAMPLMVFATMPVAIMGMLLMPFGLDAIAWQIMGISIEYILHIAEMVASWERAVVAVADIGFPAFASTVLGGLVLTLFRTPLRLVGLMPLVAAYLLALNVSLPDIIIGRDGKNMAFRMKAPDSKPQLILYSLTTERFAAGNWLAAAGQSEGLDGLRIVKDFVEDDETGSECNSLRCRVTLPDGLKIVVSETLPSLLRACSQADIVIARYQVPEVAVADCRAILIDRSWLNREGAVTIYLAGNGKIKIATNKSHRGKRPWAVYSN